MLLAIIAARGGSKGVKNKNVRELAGKPLITHTIEQLKQWGKFDKLIVSTDSEDIAKVARNYDIEIPFMRPQELANDSVGKLDVLRHALCESEKIYNLRFDIILDLDVTAPIRTEEDIDKAVNMFKEKNVNCVFSAVKSQKSPYFNMAEIDAQGMAIICKQLPQQVLRRQDCPVVYAMNASIYVYSREFLLDKTNKSVFSGRASIYEMSEISAVDIDSELDFKHVEFLMNSNQGDRGCLDD